MQGLPQRLSETGCFDPADPRRPLPALIPYDVNVPLWSDGASKERWLALPDGARIRIRPDSDFELPPGTVTIKTFSLAGQRIETRFFVRKMSGEWAGYTYRWNEAGTDAFVQDEGSQRQPTQLGEWHHPSRSECRKCHTPEAGYSLGLEIGQLNRTFDYGGGRVANQVVTFAHIGLFESAPTDDVRLLPAFPDPADATTSIAERARAYLHSNCSNCHRPGDDEPGLVDFRFATFLSAAMACDAEPLKGSLGFGPQMRIIVPGRAEDSMVIQRMRILESGRMPAVASLVVDDEGVALLSEWIRQLTACP